MQFADFFVVLARIVRKKGVIFMYAQKRIALAMTAVMLLSCTACHSESKGEIGTANSESVILQERDPTLFDTYVSNTVIASGSNTAVMDVNNVTYRAWIPVEAAGEFEYCFYFSNLIDSTWDKGKKTHAGMSGSDYEILSASVSDGGTEFDPNVVPEKTVPVTFSDSISKKVTAEEVFWSDPVTLDIPEGHYLLWEWTLNGDCIPATNMSDLAYSYADEGKGKGFIYAGQVPLPKLFGCKRNVKTRLVTLGDSITQGCGTTQYGTDFWAAQLLQQLGTEEYSLWNLGLGYARASDCALGGDWLNRAVAAADVITVAYGVNDIISGPYGGNGTATPEEIDQSVRTILGAFQPYNIDTILWNIPPFDLSDKLEPTRVDYNAKVSQIAQDTGASFFDAAVLLADPEDASKTVYGQHPDAVGGKVLADALATEIGSMTAE